MKKNHVTGSLAVSGKKYRAMLRIPDIKTGKQKQIGITLDVEAKKGNKRKAKKHLEALIIEYENKKEIDDNKKLFADFLSWFVEFHKNNVSITTHTNYKHMLDKHIIPYFESKDILLENLTTGDLQEYFHEKNESGLSPKTLKNHRGILSVALTFAYKKEFIQKNLIDLLDNIKGADKEYEYETYDVEELKQLLSLVNKEKLIAPIFLCCAFGLRRSEALGVCLSDFDLENKTFTLNRTVVTSTIEHKTTILIRENVYKTKNSKATFIITPFIEDFIFEIISTKAKNKILFSDMYNTEFTDFLCVDEVGNLIKPDYISHDFPKLLEKYNLRKIRLHDLRHSFITNVQALTTNDKVLQKIARHADANFTRKRYVHIKDDTCKKELTTYLNSLGLE